MKFPTSTAVYGEGPSTQQFNTLNEDAIRSFKLFLDLITPAEFSKLLRARVRHLLETWPPQNDPVTSPSSSTVPTRSGLPSPTFESIRAFAAFFRTQDSPGPSTIELSAATSLSTLYHNLLALQTLLSFLSGRELKDIVRARLSEGGKTRLVSVQGLMDIMRNAGGDGEEHDEDGTEGAGVKDEDIWSDGEKTNEVGGQSVATGPAPSLVSKVSKRKGLAKSQDGMKSDLPGDGQPPKKRQRVESSGKGDAKDGGSPTFPVQFPSTSQPLSQERATPCYVRAHLALPVRTTSSASTSTGRSSNVHAPDALPASRLSESEQTPPSELSSQPIINRQLTPGSQPNPDSGHEMPVILHLKDVNMETSDQEPGGSKQNPDDSEDEDEVGGLVVTLIDEADTSGFHPAVSPMSKGPPSENASPTSNPVPTIAEIAPAPPTNFQLEREKLTIPSSSDAEPAPAVSREESNRRRMRAVLGLPPTELEKSERPAKPPSTGPEITKGVVAEQPQGLRHILNSSIVSGTNESATTAAIAANSSSSLSHGSPFNLVRAHSSASPRPCRGIHIARSRSHSPSLADSDLDDDRASPPGPVLRAVDWASGVMTVPSDEMEVDELEGDHASDDTLALGKTVFTTDGVIKSSAAAYARKAFPSHHVAWPGSEIVDGDAGDWGDDGEQAFDMEKAAQSNAKGDARKLYIRLPARPRNRAGMTSTTGTDASRSVSPAPPSSTSRVSPLSEKGRKEDMHITPSAALATKPPDVSMSSEPDAKENQQIPLAEDTKIQSPPSAGPSKSTPATPGPSSAPNASPPQPPSQPAPISRTQSASPSMPPHGPHPLQHHPGAFPHPGAHAYPGPWFGAMFYVPLRGHPHMRGHPHPHAHPHAGMQPRHSLPKMPIPIAGPSKPSPHVESGFASAPGPGPAGGSGPSTPEGIKKASKRKSSTDPAEVNDAPAPMEVDPDVTYTDDVGVKETPTIKRRCFNCLGVQAPSWRKSKLNVGKILCNKCGIYESTHMTPRPLKTRPRRSTGEGGPSKKRKSPKKAV